MYAIGEFSKLSGLTVKTLRFYHEKGLLVPASVDAGSGYRYYDHGSVEKARVIVSLRDLGFSLDDIGEILASHDDDADILAFLRKRKETVAGELRRGQDVISKLATIIQTETAAREAIEQSSFRVEEKEIGPMLVAGVRMKGKYSDCGRGFATLGKRVGRYIQGKPFCLYYDSEYHEDDADLEPCFPIRKHVEKRGVSVRELPNGRFVCLMHAGPYRQIGRSYDKAMRHAKNSGYELLLPSREVYVKGPGMIFKGNPKKYVTEIQLPVKPAPSPADAEWA